VVDLQCTRPRQEVAAGARLGNVANGHREVRWSIGTIAPTLEPRRYTPADVV
jgi:hypothetical protein